MIVAECPECGFPVFAHTATTTQETAAFPTCDHVAGVSAIDIPEYDPDRERRTVEVIMQLFHNLRSIVISYNMKYGDLDEPEEEIEVEGKVVA